MKVSKEVQRPQGQALGDCWMDLNYFINWGLENNEITRLSQFYRKGHKQKWAIKLKEILPLLEHEEMVQLGEWEPTLPKHDWRLGWKYPYIPTKETWKPNSSKKICYQFDAKSKKPTKFPSIEVENEVLEHATNLGYEVVRLGHSTGLLVECVHEVATAELFLGVDSGMTKLASSVGTPILYTKNNRLLEWSCDQSNKHFVLAEDATELKACLDAYHKGGLEYYVDNATHVELFKRRQNV